MKLERKERIRSTKLAMWRRGRVMKKVVRTVKAMHSLSSIHTTLKLHIASGCAPSNADSLPNFYLVILRPLSISRSVEVDCHNHNQEMKTNR
eukprot:scaffold3716_cov69-Cylindrotheca_fusiformis.AAC.19